ncbi:hypothetical protein ABT186_02195 [Streptomyces sp. NPDC001634]|uniref:hypothetical protein n=1 Tax=Streptomyces sp. NPDC001634 TaxID=3154390 RepID=UPI00332F3BC1
MSQTTNQNQYNFDIKVSDSAGGNYGDIIGTLNDAQGMTDALANQIVKAINAITTPAGVTINATVDKQTVTWVSYSTGYGTNPITFS